MQKVVNLQNFFCPVVKSEISGFAPLAEIQKKAALRTDICDHLQNLFTITLSERPQLVVELGVRGGESTFVFERAAKLTGAKLLSVDFNDCKDVTKWPEWNFVQSDDIVFAKQFVDFCSLKGWCPEIDILFIDTSHEYDHTVEEIKYWFPFITQGGLAIFHDTNLRELYRRRDGSWGQSWDNQRGVIRAIEGYFGREFDENFPFIAVEKDWLIWHEPICDGFTVMKKILLGKTNL